MNLRFDRTENIRAPRFSSDRIFHNECIVSFLTKSIDFVPRKAWPAEGGASKATHSLVSRPDLSNSDGSVIGRCSMRFEWDCRGWENDESDQRMDNADRFKAAYLQVSGAPLSKSTSSESRVSNILSTSST